MDNTSTLTISPSCENFFNDKIIDMTSKMAKTENEFYEQILTQRWMRALQENWNTPFEEFARDCRVETHSAFSDKGSFLFYRDELIAWLGPWVPEQTESSYIMKRASWHCFSKEEDASSVPPEVSDYLNAHSHQA
jgi:hypothetical protein